MPTRALITHEDRVLPRSFYSRRTDIVARELLGKLIVHKTSNSVISGKIVETEAYFGGGEDPASHAHRGPTARSSIMFGKSGLAYVYFNYGVHWLLNFVAKESGRAGAVLIRAVQPVEGIEIMLANRGVKVANVTNGPGKLTKAMAIDGSYNGIDVTKPSSRFYVASLMASDFKVGQSRRIGINKGEEKQLRFFVKNNPFVSRKDKNYR